MSATITEAFTTPVSLLDYDCDGCGFSLALSENHIGALVGVEGVVRVWHEDCAPAALRAAHAAAIG